VVRVNLTLRDNPYSFYKAAQVVLDWWNDKALPYDAIIGPDTPTLSFTRSSFKVDFARTEGAFALAMEEPDSTVPDRSWIVDVGLREVAGQTEFGLRASFRQPYSTTILPEPRSPRFLRNILDEVGAIDHWELRPTYQSVDEDSVELLVELVESPLRRLPVLVISEEPQTGAIFTDPERLSKFVAGTAHVCLLKAGTSWDLTRHWGSEWSVFQGAIRCYNPGFNRNGDKFRHRLWFADNIQRLDANSRYGFANTVTSHVFTQITALFESVPLVTPSSIKRELDESSRSSVPGLTDTLDSTQMVETSRENAHSTAPTDVLPALDGVPEFFERRQANVEILNRLLALEESSLKLEHDLQEERAARAETESKLSDVRAELEMFEKENVRLEEQQAIAFGDVSKEPSEALRPLWEKFSGLFNAMQTVGIKFRRMEQDGDKIESLEQHLAKMSQDLLNRNATIESLNKRRSSSEGDIEASEESFRTEIVAMLPQVVRKELSLVDLLQLIKVTFPKRLVILDTAFNSAEESSTFLHTEQAFDLLWLLATEYWEELKAKGDIEARKVFGKSYASNEGDNLSKSGIKRRTFKYHEHSLLMLKHLKLGTAFNSSDTLRIHFEWMADEELIVVGHCGKHLNF
jgi:hypothetical protein